jgi:hypothetical protein
MKTFWPEATVNRNSDKAGFANPQDYLSAKAKEFERDSGVKWSVSHQGGGYQFDAIDDGIPIASTVAEQDVEAIVFAYRGLEKGFAGYVTYVQISEKTGISLRRLIPIVKWLERSQKARRTVNRMGKGYAFKLSF